MLNNVEPLPGQEDLVAWTGVIDVNTPKSELVKNKDGKSISCRNVSSFLALDAGIGDGF